MKEFIPKHSIQLLNELNVIVADGRPIFPTHKKKEIDSVKLKRQLLRQISLYVTDWQRSKGNKGDEIDLSRAEKIMGQMQEKISAWFISIESDTKFQVTNVLLKLRPSKLDIDHAVLTLLVWSCIDDSLRILHAKVNRSIKHDFKKTATAVHEVIRSLFEIDACLFPSLAPSQKSKDTTLPLMASAIEQLSFRNTQVAKEFLAGRWPHKKLFQQYSKTASPYRAFSIVMLRELLTSAGYSSSDATSNIQDLYRSLGTGMNIGRYTSKSLHNEIEFPDPAIIWKEYSMFLLSLEIAPIR